jgi:hypothetical protein
MLVANSEAFSPGSVATVKKRFGELPPHTFTSQSILLSPQPRPRPKLSYAGYVSFHP